ncbi:hypothetical protein FE257_012047 [Aspergillus nanangensis]|uniref:Citrate exporter 1 n=1 Tax=Aspergillus nanangensis TaxID=2582783 RepID=A0AAD4CIA7_ASPNN|nr:hypothetical protein FE257_012047 [Aspergillus nanangensis]
MAEPISIKTEPTPDPEKTQHVEARQDNDDETEPEALYSILPERQKILTIVICSVITFLSPVAANMYYPALGPLARDLHVSQSKINLTITSFKIIQAFAPLLTASLSDVNGRRPIFLLGLVVFLGSNIGLALQGTFVALLVLRCFQSFGSSSISNVSSAAVADLVTRAERGKYLFYATLGNTIGPAVGPVLGGILAQFMGWRSIFWFLVIMTGVMVMMVVLFLRETCRAVVGNGSLPPQPWNEPLLHMVRPVARPPPDEDTRVVFKRRPGVLDTVRIVWNKHIGLLILCSSLRFSGSMAVLSTLPALLERKYNYNALQVGLCYIPYAVGGLVTRWSVGTIADWNFRRHAHKNGVEIQQNKQSQRQLQQIPLEKARLQITIPMMYYSCVCILGYGWIMNYNVHVAGPLIILFLIGNSNSGVNNSLNMLVIDLHAQRPASALAAMNTFKNLAAAGMAAGALPLIDAIGIGWMGTMFAGLWVLVSPTLWAIYFFGQGWRKNQLLEE